MGMVFGIISRTKTCSTVHPIDGTDVIGPWNRQLGRGGVAQWARSTQKPRINQLSGQLL